MKKVILDGKYILGGTFGCWVESEESATINKGDVRVIGGVLMQAYLIKNPPWYSLNPDRVTWIPADEKMNTMESFRAWVARL